MFARRGVSAASALAYVIPDPRCDRIEAASDRHGQPVYARAFPETNDEKTWGYESLFTDRDARSVWCFSSGLWAPTRHRRGEPPTDAAIIPKEGPAVARV